MKIFNVKFQENEKEFTATIQEKIGLESPESKYYLRELIINKNDNKLIELGFKTFICWYLGDKFFEIKTISSNEFNVIKL
jgi:hypothetical protein